MSCGRSTTESCSAPGWASFRSRRSASGTQDARAQLPVDVRKKLDDTKREIADINDLARVLKELFATHGNDLDHSFMVFEYGHQTHLVVKMGPRTKANVERLVDDARSWSRHQRSRLPARWKLTSRWRSGWPLARPLTSGFRWGWCSARPTSLAAAQVIRQAIDAMEKAGDVNPTNRWQALEYLCAEYLEEQIPSSTKRSHRPRKQKRRVARGV